MSHTIVHSRITPISNPILTPHSILKPLTVIMNKLVIVLPKLTPILHYRIAILHYMVIIVLYYMIVIIYRLSKLTVLEIRWIHDLTVRIEPHCLGRTIWHLTTINHIVACILYVSIIRCYFGRRQLTRILHFLLYLIIDTQPLMFLLMDQ